MAIKKYAIETIEAEQEQFTEFTEADIESLEFAPEDLEAFEAESTETISLENVDPESVVESLESWMNGEEPYNGSTLYGNNSLFSGGGNGSTGRSTPLSPSKSVSKQLLKTFTIIIQKLVKKIMSNPKTRAKLQAAVRKGPTAVSRILTLSVSSQLPIYFRWLAPIFVPKVTRTLFPPLRQQAGVGLEEVEEAPEFDSNGSF